MLVPGSVVPSCKSFFMARHPWPAQEAVRLLELSGEKPLTGIGSALERADIIRDRFCGSWCVHCGQRMCSKMVKQPHPGGQEVPPTPIQAGFNLDPSSQPTWKRTGSAFSYFRRNDPSIVYPNTTKLSEALLLPHSDGLHPNSHGLQPKSDGLQ